MSKINKLTASLLVALALTMTISVVTIRSHTQEQSHSNLNRKPSMDGQGVDFKSRFPVVDYNAPKPTDPESLAKRDAKNKRYDKLSLVRKNSSSEIEETVRDIPWQKNVG